MCFKPLQSVSLCAHVTAGCPLHPSACICCRTVCWISSEAQGHKQWDPSISCSYKEGPPVNWGHLVGLITTWMGELRDRKHSQTGRCWGKHFSVRKKRNNDQVYFRRKHLWGFLPDDSTTLSPLSTWTIAEQCSCKMIQHLRWKTGARGDDFNCLDGL